LKTLEGKRERNSTGDKRIWKFDTKVLNRFSKAFKQISDSIEIVEIVGQETLESVTGGSQTTTTAISLFQEEEE
jgi:hypothetical protein